MNSLPLLFTGDMVIAMMRENEPKTQTRRRVKRLKRFGPITEFQASTTPGYDWEFRDKRGLWNSIPHSRLMDACPYGMTGDRIWAKESYSISSHVRDKVTGRITVGGRYIADQAEFEVQLANMESVKFLQWRQKLGVHPNMFMFRSLSRITLQLVDRWVEPLQNICEDDAVAEGVEFDQGWEEEAGEGFQGGGGFLDYMSRDNAFRFPTAVDSFRSLVEKIHGPGRWEENPHMFALEFKRVTA